MNRTVFSTNRGHFVPSADTVNEAGGRAYQMSPKEALAQLAVTACFNDTFYVSAETQVDKVLELCSAVPPEFVAKTAVYARSKGRMKDAPALLLAYLSKRDVQMFRRIFHYVADNPGMVKRVAHIIRSGVVGRKSFGTAVRNTFRGWFDRRSDDQLFRANVGGDLSLADLIKLTHPKPESDTRNALYAYLIGKQPDIERLPALVRQFEAWKREPTGEIPDVPFLMLTGGQLPTEAWAHIARTCSWTSTRMNINTFLRHGVFADPKMVELVAAKLANPELVRRSGVFPYQLLTAYQAMGSDVPMVIRNALQDAMEIATENVPKVDGKVVVCVDCSGSMNTPVTGVRQGATTKTSAREAAALIASVFMRMNQDTHVIPFTEVAYKITPQLNPRDSVMTNARLLAGLPAGGTNCAAPMEAMNTEGRLADLVIYASDNESWYDSGGAYRGTGRTAPPLATAWAEFKVRNPKARMVCIDLAPNTTRQADQRPDTLNIGGFSDQVFEVIVDFMGGKTGGVVDEIEKVDISGWSECGTTFCRPDEIMV